MRFLYLCLSLCTKTALGSDISIGLTLSLDYVFHRYLRVSKHNARSTVIFVGLVADVVGRHGPIASRKELHNHCVAVDRTIAVQLQVFLERIQRKKKLHVLLENRAYSTGDEYLFAKPRFLAHSYEGLRALVSASSHVHSHMFMSPL